MNSTATLDPTATTRPGVSDHDYGLMLAAATSTARQFGPVVESNALAEELATLCQPFEAISTRATDYSKCGQSGAHWAL